MLTGALFLMVFNSLPLGNFMYIGIVILVLQCSRKFSQFRKVQFPLNLCLIKEKTIQGGENASIDTTTCTSATLRKYIERYDERSSLIPQCLLGHVISIDSSRLENSSCLFDLLPAYKVRMAKKVNILSSFLIGRLKYFGHSSMLV